MSLILTTEAGFSVKKYALGVNLALRQLNVPIVLIAGNVDGHESRAIPFCQEATHASHAISGTRRRHGEADINAISSRMILFADGCSCQNLQVVIYNYCRLENHSEGRKLPKWVRFWRMLIPHQGESVICRYEQIVTRDVRLVVKGWTMRFCRDLILYPLQLRFAIQGCPSGHGPSMYGQMLQLGWGAGIQCLDPPSGITPSIPMVKGHAARRTVGIRKEY